MGDDNVEDGGVAPSEACQPQFDDHCAKRGVCGVPAMGGFRYMCGCGEFRDVPKSSSRRLGTNDVAL